MRPTILVIDDDQPMLWLVSQILKNFEVVTKSDGLEAMLWLSSGNFPDLILLDREMPNLNGKEFLRGLRGSGMFKDVPVLLLSSCIDNDFKDEVHELGVREFITKPFDPVFLLEKVEQNLPQEILI